VPKLVNLGSLNIDDVFRVTRIARPGETVAGRERRQYAGGKGFNQSLAAACAGAAVNHFGCIGTDSDWLRQELASAAVDVTGVRMIPGADTGRALIQVEDSGENAIVVFGGANLCLEATDIDAALRALDGGDWLLIQNEINRLPDILNAARDIASKVAFNVAPVDDRVRECDLGGVDLLIVNATEAAELSGIDGPSDTMLTALCQRWPACQVVLTRGADGLSYGCGERRGAVAAFPVKTVDTTGAGDAFVGYLMASLLDDQPIRTALIRASAAGALATTRPGAGASIPESGAVAALLNA
jgi:ribokinase